MAKSKYSNKKVVGYVNGKSHVFDSTVELHRYNHLLLLEKAKKIKFLSIQPSFELQEKFKRNNKTHRAITYKADFVYEIETKVQGSVAVCEDVKGFRTDMYQLKKKLFLKMYGDKFKFIEVKKDGKKWIETEI